MTGGPFASALAPAVGALIIGAISEALALQWPIAGGAVLRLAAWLWVMPQRHSIAKAMEQAPAV